ncbi:TetR/AcrR family transcriptional regulator [Allonocardiopsis opalescens]|uniref:TetR family transcriptional regulator n=1 Tax=Allonocardiopsis opalescens TaxID=1144618 RepID=A0A2T0Q0L0_9ACTN|nr:TetR/AcrR family transcriptional regulator [Allonocardiopsis opalescens]PRX97331.1 TetR family transcriptional regulator [Allonocardiopsis opalescens]
MVRQNTQRRTALLDAAVDVLAREGARGLTYRALDGAAGVPAGTASNYFANRTELLAQAAAHVYVRLAPSDAVMAEMAAQEPSREVVRRAMHELYERITADGAGYLALLELRLEATRRPEVRAAVAERIGRDIHANIGFHVEGGYPGGRGAVVALYLAMTGLMVERLTLPEAWEWTGFPALIDELVGIILPE